MKLRLELYVSPDGWRWRMRRGRRILAESGQGYPTHGDCEKALAAILVALWSGNITYKPKRG